MRPITHAILAMLAALMWTLFATDYVLADEAADFTLCHQATATAEHGSGVPDQLLDAISRVESGRYDKTAGAVRAWPWTINAEGEGHFYTSRHEAVEAARQLQARGIRSMDVGCTQINLMYHPNAFGSLEDAFDPDRNATYAARFLTELFHQAGSWPHAAAAYHSQTPELGTDYQHKVLEAWSTPLPGSAAAMRSDHPSGLRMSDFHPQLTHLFQSPGIRSPSVSMASSTSSRPFGRSLSASPGGSGHILRSGASLSGVSGRNLSAYRLMPVAMLTTRPRPARY
jgi:hypothetical protein